jgi:hypothetical protein
MLMTTKLDTRTLISKHNVELNNYLIGLERIFIVAGLQLVYINKFRSIITYGVIC